MGALSHEVIRDNDFCDLANRWGVQAEVMRRLSIAAEEMYFETKRLVWIISGFRSAEEQMALRRSGRPASTDALSTHRSCPATGVDIWLGPLPSRVLKVVWGRIVVFNGLRWGGGSPIDPKTGIPKDWNHVDLGPRVLASATP